MSRDTDRVWVQLRAFVLLPTDHRADGTHFAKCDIEFVRKRLGIKRDVMQKEIDTLIERGEIEVKPNEPGFLWLRLY